MPTPTDLRPFATEHRRAQPWLGTLVEVSSPSEGDDAADWGGFSQACDAAFKVVAHVHACMSLHRPDSDLARLAAAEPDEVVVVNAYTAEVLRLAAWVEQRSSGRFNAAACVPDLIARGRLPPLARTPDSRPGSVLHDLAWLPPADEGPGHRRVRVVRPVAVDLGGIAKGWAVDAAVKALQGAGLRRGLVNAGGDLRVFGPWDRTISVRHPGRADGVLPLLCLAEGALATTSFQREEPRDRPWPRAVVVSGEARRARGGGNDDDDDRPWHPSVSVLAPSCALADALTKVLMIGGLDVAPLLRECEAQGVGVDVEGHVHHV